MRAKQRVVRLLRACIPSAVLLSRSPAVRLVGRLVDGLVSLFFREARGLPPNWLRLRAGVGDRPFLNQFGFRYAHAGFWLRALASGDARLDASLVDLGCGCGRTAIHLRDFVSVRGMRFTGRYLGVDIDPEAIAWCRAHFPADRFTFQLNEEHGWSLLPGSGGGGSYRLPLEDGTQDYVFAMSLFTHLLEPELRNYLEESRRVLRSGARLEGTVFCLEHLRTAGRLGGRWTFRHTCGNAQVENARFPEAVVAYGEGFLLGLGREAGFRSVELTYEGLNSWLSCAT